MKKVSNGIWFVKELWLQKWDKLEIFWWIIVWWESQKADAEIQEINNSCIWIQDSKDRRYCISNIAQLLSLNPEFGKSQHEYIYNILWNINSKDNKNRQASVAKIPSDILENLISWKYEVYNSSVWYSFDPVIDQIKRWEKTIRPTDTLITNDVEWFRPLNKFFSVDSRNWYYMNYNLTNLHPEVFQVCDPKSLKPIWNSHYAYDKGNVYYGFHEIEWAYITNNNYKIIKGYHKDWSDDILVDSNGKYFYGLAEIPSYKSETMELVDNFVYNGSEVFLLSGLDTFSLNEMFSIPKWNNIEHIWDHSLVNNDKYKHYKIWDMELYYDGEMWLYTPRDFAELTAKINSQDNK